MGLEDNKHGINPEWKTISHQVIKDQKCFGQCGCEVTLWRRVPLSSTGKQNQHKNIRLILDQTPGAQTYQKHKG